MYCLLIQLILIIFYENVSASTYNTKCNITCDFPGMRCIKNRCICDQNSRLFWTGARCLACPPNWAMSERACIAYYGTKTSWMSASAICRVMEGELISLRDSSIVSLIYQVTGGNNGRRKRRQVATDKTIVWTSAHALDLTNLGLYQWKDKNLKRFDSGDSRWCKRGEWLGYFHPDNEPTRRIYNNNGAEKCVLLRRGISGFELVCLDDVLCHLEYPFICERTESTAQEFDGISSNMGNSSGSTGNTNSNVNNSSSAHGNKNPNTNNGNQLSALAEDENKDSKSMIIIVALILLLLAGIITSIFCYLKHRNGKEVQVGNKNIKGNQTPSDVRGSYASSTNISVTNDGNESSSSSHSENGLTLENTVSPENIEPQKQQTVRRGGYSKQNFDEFE